MESSRILDVVTKCGWKESLQILMKTWICIPSNISKSMEVDMEILRPQISLGLQNPECCQVWLWFGNIFILKFEVWKLLFKKDGNIIKHIFKGIFGWALSFNYKTLCTFFSCFYFAKCILSLLFDFLKFSIGFMICFWYLRFYNLHVGRVRIAL